MLNKFNVKFYYDVEEPNLKISSKFQNFYTQKFNTFQKTNSKET